ncbi:hypothetical protein TWF718_001878 [Orbilia javanica]|uniref:Uncharacterized protein n=1 Tax=Orbilia javanica TaxID=47235 RepID=A0AAN8RHP6_9PEZI
MLFLPPRPFLLALLIFLSLATAVLPLPSFGSQRDQDAPLSSALGELATSTKSSVRTRNIDPVSATGAAEHTGSAKSGFIATGANTSDPVLQKTSYKRVLEASSSLTVGSLKVICPSVYHILRERIEKHVTGERLILNPGFPPSFWTNELARFTKLGEIPQGSNWDTSHKTWKLVNWKIWSCMGCVCDYKGDLMTSHYSADMSRVRMQKCRGNFMPKLCVVLYGCYCQVAVKSRKEPAAHGHRFIHETVETMREKHQTGYADAWEDYADSEGLWGGAPAPAPDIEFSPDIYDEYGNLVELGTALWHHTGLDKAAPYIMEKGNEDGGNQGKGKGTDRSGNNGYFWDHQYHNPWRGGPPGGGDGGSFFGGGGYLKKRGSEDLSLKGSETSGKESYPEREGDNRSKGLIVIDPEASAK